MAIPEFILKKLIVPGSFKTHTKGFSFSILNSFAPAVITSFRIFISNQQVPETCVSLTSDTLGTITGSDIHIDHPVPLSVGNVVTVTVKDFPPVGPIRITAMTREVGELDFTLSEGASKNKATSIKTPFFRFLDKPKSANIDIDSQNVAGHASPYLLGQFVEHLEKCVYDGIWTSDGSSLREDTLDLVRQLNPPMIRYPGGNFASGYHWEDGIGPRAKRPARHDAAWQAEESNQVGTDEFLAFCHLINTEPCLVVNDGSGSPEEAARWVAYCNSAPDTEQGARRTLNGHREPYNVKYWGLGNEVWGPWQIGTVSAEEYVRRIKHFITAMKNVDPTIKFIAVGNNPLTDDPDDPATLWNKTVLENLSEEIDFLSWHIYQPEKSGWKESYDAMELYHAVCSASVDMEQIIDRVEHQIDQYSKGRKIMQAVDEWNLWLPPLEKNVSMHHVTYTMRDALYVSSVLIAFMKHSHTVGMANLAQLVNVLPLIETNPQSAIATSIFYPFVLFSQMHDRILVSNIESEGFNSQQIDINMAAHSKVPYLDGIATCNANMDRYSVLLVNRYPIDKMEVSIDFTASEAMKPSHALQIYARSPQAYNTFKNPFRVRISDARVPVKKDNHWKITLKPCSVYFVEFIK